MKLSTRARYGLRAMIDLADHGEEAVSIQSIAQRQRISDSYLEQLMGKLRRAGLVTSLRGVTGGYRLARDAQEISVGEILRVLEGGLDAVECPELTGKTQAVCSFSDGCVSKIVWKRINDGIHQAVDTFMLSDLLSSIQEPERKASGSKEDKNGQTDLS